jgi:hypothetical protein
MIGDEPERSDGADMISERDPRRSPGEGEGMPLSRPLALLVAVLSLGATVVVSSGAYADSAPVVTQQPEIAVVAAAGEATSFTAAASGSPTPTVRWEEGIDRAKGPWMPISGTSTTLNVTASSAHLGHAFRAIFTNASGTAITRPARLIAKTDWMSDLGDDIADEPISELTIPGSHDTGTYGASGDGDLARDGLLSHCPDDAVCQSYAKAQSRGTTDELNDGIRYFDLRVCGEGSLPTDPFPPDFKAISGDPVTCHGVTSARFGEILFHASLWAGDHPNELLILDVNHEFEVNQGLLATQIEDAFKTDTGSLLIPPPYCPPGDPDSGTCAGSLTLRKIRAMAGHPNVIVNFENDGAPGETDCFACGTRVEQDFYRQPTDSLDSTFYDDHQSLWGRVGLIYFTKCTRGGSFTSCFGNETDRFDVLRDAIDALATRQTFAEPPPDGPPYLFNHMFVQFLQTTPDPGFIAGNPDRSLLDMAISSDIGSNLVVGPGLFGCGDWNIYDCRAQFFPENVNIVAENFYEQIVQSSGQPFDFVKEVARFDEYARTAPVVTVGAGIQPASTGWYNAATLGGQGSTLSVEVTAEDYRWPTGIATIGCNDSGASSTFTFPVTKTVPTDAGTGSATETASLGEGIHTLDCTATDNASEGLHGVGNEGAGPGSVPSGTFKVDTVPPTITCPTQNNFILHQPVSSVAGTVTDDGSGVASSSAGAISTANVGTFTTSLTASDVAGNTASKVCTYTVTYKVDYRYDTTKAWSSGSTVPIKVELDDYFNKDVSAKNIVVTAKSVTNLATNTKTPPSSPGGTNSQMIFYVSPTNGYEYDLKTTGFRSGSYTLDFMAGNDPTTYHAPFRIK